MAFGYAVYFTERDKNRVVRWEPDSGDVTVVAGESSEKDQSLNNPYGLAFDSTGTLLIADKFNHRICRLVKGRLVAMQLMDREGSRKRRPDSSPTYNPVPMCPTAIFVEPGDAVLCSFSDDCSIYRIQSDGTLQHLLGIIPNRNYFFDDQHPITFAPPQNAKEVPLHIPTGIVERKDGTIVFIERGPQLVRKFHPEVGLECVFSPANRPSMPPPRVAPDRASLWEYHPGFPSSLVLDSDENLYVTETTQGCVLRVHEDSKEVSKVISVRQNDDPMSGIAAMAFGADGIAWILNVAEGCVEAYAPQKAGIWKSLGIRLTSVRGEPLRLPIAGSGLALGK